MKTQLITNRLHGGFYLKVSQKILRKIMEDTTSGNFRSCEKYHYKDLNHLNGEQGMIENIPIVCVFKRKNRK